MDGPSGATGATASGRCRRPTTARASSPAVIIAAATSGTAVACPAAISAPANTGATIRSSWECTWVSTATRASGQVAGAAAAEAVSTAAR